jgi:hypothetical protein
LLRRGLRSLERYRESALRPEAKVDVKLRRIKSVGPNFQDVAARPQATKSKFAGIRRVRLFEEIAAIITEIFRGVRDTLVFGLRINGSREADRRIASRLRASWGRKSKKKNERRETQEEVDPTHRPPPSTADHSPQTNSGIVTAG